MSSGIADLFGEYFADLYQENHIPRNLVNNAIPSDDPILNSDLLFSETVNIVSQLKNNKSPGLDQIQNEHIKYGGRKLLEKLFNDILKFSHIPESWKSHPDNTNIQR